MPRKRTHDEIAQHEIQEDSVVQALSQKVRNLWEFAAFFEWLNLFGSVVKISKIDIEDYEYECIKPGSSKWLEETGLAILKFVSSRRDLTLENWDETVRRQYEYKREGKPHPYGNDEAAANKFNDFHIFTKLRVLYQLAAWTFHNPDRIRQHFADFKEQDQFYEWQAHPVGWDRHSNTYYALSGNRLYRRVDPPAPEPKTKTKPKYTSKKAQAARRRQSKRRKTLDPDDADTEMADGDETMNGSQADDEKEPEEQTIANADPETLNTFGDYKWECVAITLDDFNNFLASLTKSKDPDEKLLRAYVQEEMLPELERAKERRERKEAERLRELQLAEKMLGAKRSGRLAAKQEKEREDAEAAEAERQKQALLAEARKAEEQQHKLENERRSRMQTRDQRIREREYKRVLLEEQLARDSEDEKRLTEEGAVRGTRHLKERIKKNKQQLDEWDGDDWSFDCAGCGQHGKNFDDGEHSIACERCNVWQHSKCHGFTPKQAERDDFNFVCDDCKQRQEEDRLRREEEANRPKISLKFKLGSSSSPPQPAATSPKQHPQESPTKRQPVLVNVSPVPRPALADSTKTQSATAPASDITQAPKMAPTSQSQQQIESQPSLPAYPQNKSPKAMPYMNGGPPAGFLSSPRGQTNLQPPAHSAQLSSQPNLQPTRPASSHSPPPRPISSHSLVNGNSSPVRRVASPIINRPTMSPTQGNPEVGRIAGVPGSSPSLQPATLATPHVNGQGPRQNGSFSVSTPQNQQTPQSSFSASQNGGQMSGLSPVKQQTPISHTPLPQPTLVPQKQRQPDGSFTTPSSSFNHDGRMRSVSGTPIFPPTEKLAPSPHQLNPGPVPTPSKQSPPLPQGSFDTQVPSFQLQSDHPSDPAQ